MVKIGTTQAQKKLFFNLNKEKAKLEREGFDFSPKMIADRLNVKESEVLEMEQRLSSPDLSVDAPLGGDSDNTWLSILPTSSPNSEELYADQEISNLLNKAIKKFKTTLNDRYLIVFERRVISQEKQTLQQLADTLDVSIERVRQIEVAIIKKFKEFIEEHYQNVFN